ncbi:hypothetical protein [Halorubrum lacusprofundi]|nr:hypothetical protein [Halorubrum lacusprofundi]
MAFGREHNGRTSRPLFDAGSTIDTAPSVADAYNFLPGGHHKVTIGGTV